MVRRVAIALLLGACGCSSSGNDGGTDSGCIAQGAACNGTVACCGGLACYSSVCCQSAGGSCGGAMDCCSGACDAGTCACSMLGFGCASSSDCCQGQCLDGGTCGYYGTVAISASSCGYVGLFDGGPLYQFNVSLSGSAAGPGGGGLTFFSDPGNPINTPAIGCGTWSANTAGYQCSPAAGQPSSTSWTWSYAFASSSRTGTINPSVTVDDPLANQLGMAQASPMCQ